ncbi:MAG: FeoB small GTPase domain-containing protein, partial [Hydrogenoanaerobacterium sp.]
MSYSIALAGNPNCGKTTLFNELTGSNQYVGNWAGVTVEKKEGKASYNGAELLINDLPGIYSLSPYTMEEVCARDYIMHDDPDVIINIIDGTNIERNLYLTIQLMELGRPMIIAVNMMDDVEQKGETIDCDRLAALLGVPVLPIVAR